MLPFLFFLLCFCSSVTSSSSLCHPDEAAALLHFKHSFSIISSSHYCSTWNYDNVFWMPSNETSYPKTKYWKESSNDCCRWEGVSCDNVTGHVIGLDLSCSQLRGSFPPNSTLFNLLDLQTLNLASNDFLGSKIPVELGLRLTTLKHLDLSNTSFYGHVPSKTSHLSNLEYLDLSYNDVEMEGGVFGQLVQNLSQIRHLFLDSVNMSYIQVNLLANFSATLTSFTASECQMKGRLPEGILNRPKLELIDLSESSALTGYLPDSIDQSTSLKYLYLGYCGLSGSIPNSLGNLSHLVSLDLAYNYFASRQFLHFLTNLTQLRQLRLSGSLLSGFIPDHDGVFPGLQVLELSDNNLTGTIPLWIHNQTQLKALILSGNLLTGSIPDFIRNKLQYLLLDQNKFQGIVPSSIYEQKDLTYLTLSSNNLSGSVDLDRLSKLQHLVLLGLGHNMLSFNTSRGVTFPSLGILDIASLGTNKFPSFLEGAIVW